MSTKKQDEWPTQNKCHNSIANMYNNEAGLGRRSRAKECCSMWLHARQPSAPKQLMQHMQSCQIQIPPATWTEPL
jgi:hypothetical protein